MTFRRFRLVFLATLTVALGVCPIVQAATGKLISETTAAQHGLTRPWFTQTELGPGFGKLTDLVLYEGTLFAQTDRAMIQAIDAETGKTIWSKQVGRPEHPSMTLGVNHDFLAVLNGSRCYVLNRYNGDLLLEKQMTGSPGAGPALSSKRLYVPLVTGMVVAYPLQAPAEPMPAESDKTKKFAKAENGKEGVSSGNADKRNLQLEKQTAPPLSCQSLGRVFIQPIVVVENPKEEYTIWPTDRGYLNLARIDRKSESSMTLKYRLETGATIVSQPAYLPPDPAVTGDSGIIVTASKDGFAYAFREKDGEPIWRYSIGSPVTTSPVAIDDRVYVTSQLGGMYCLAVKTGKVIWYAPDLFQFVAASKTKLYATDRLGQLVILDAAKGVKLDNVATEGIPIKMSNICNDRIYLASESGLIQCLHEVEQTSPVIHNENRKVAIETEEKPAVKQKELGDAEKPARHVAPKEHAAPAEHVAPRKTTTPKKKVGKKKHDEEDAGPADAFGGGDVEEKPVKGKKTGKKGKAGKNKNGDDAAGAGF